MQDEKSRDARYAQIANIDPARLAAFRAGLRRRYDDDEILAELRACAERLGRSPSMREFSMDPESTVHPQTVIDHFGSWNAAKREAGLTRAASRRARSCSTSSAGSAKSSGARRARRISTRAAARCPRSRSTGTPSAR